MQYLTFEQEKKPIVDKLDTINKLQEKCRLAQHIIFTTSQEHIYEYGIGFESDD